jgi:hypothetical protein
MHCATVGNGSRVESRTLSQHEKATLQAGCLGRKPEPLSTDEIRCAEPIQRAYQGSRYPSGPDIDMIVTCDKAPIEVGDYVRLKMFQKQPHSALFQYSVDLRRCLRDACDHQAGLREYEVKTFVSEWEIASACLQNLNPIVDAESLVCGSRFVERVLINIDRSHMSAAKRKER